MKIQERLDNVMELLSKDNKFRLTIAQDILRQDDFASRDVLIDLCEMQNEIAKIFKKLESLERKIKHREEKGEK